MEEAKRVLERLQRIELLRRQAAPPGELLVELRALLREGQAWAASEGPPAAGAEPSLRRLECALGAVASREAEEVTTRNAVV